MQPKLHFASSISYPRGSLFYIRGMFLLIYGSLLTASKRNLRASFYFFLIRPSFKPKLQNQKKTIIYESFV